MPIEKRKGETRDEFVSRCVKVEMDSGKPQDQALAICLTYADENFKSSTSSVTDNTWSTEAPISVNLESYDDYPEAAKRNAQIALDWAEKNGWGYCGTPVGKQRANQLAKGEAISRDTIARMAAFKRHIQNSQKDLGDGCGRLMWQAWGGDEGIAWAQRKLEQIDKQNLSFSKTKKIIFEEDFNEQEAKMYKDMGFKVYIRSSRKIKKRDRKVWNKLKVAGLTEDNLVFGEIKDLDKKYNFDLVLTGEDPLLEMLSLRGQEINPKRVLKSIPVESMEHAISLEQSERNSVEMKFANIKFLYKYEERPGMPPAKSGSRTFCKRMLQNNKFYTLEEIKGISNEHLKKMFAKYSGLEPDVFLYRGGFYRLPGTLNTTPFCRHQWTLKIVMD